MKYIPVQSSNIREIGYDPDRREMGVRFKTGGSFTHVDVSPEQYSALMAADSHGKHYAQHFQNKVAGMRGEPAPAAETRPTGSAPINEERPRSIEEAMERFKRPVSSGG